MSPNDGAEKQLEDWTIFFLNQTPFNTIAPVLALETPEPNEDGHQKEDGTKSELLYVLNLVRTKHDKNVRRGAIVKAMAICTRHPFIQIFKPILLMALDDYYSNPSQDCLARLFDAVNSMDISAAPILTRHEKIVMRSSERKDIFAEKFAQPKATGDSHFSVPASTNPRTATHRTTNSGSSYSSFEEGILMRKRGTERANESSRETREWERPRSRKASGAQPGIPQQPQQHESPSDSSFSLGGNPVWVGDESGLDSTVGVAGEASGNSAASTSGSTAVTSRGRQSTDASSSSSHQGKDYSVSAMPTTATYNTALTKDTHFYQTTIAYKGHQLPIKLPLSTFPEEVGDYSMIQLIQTFSNPIVTVNGPLHPHLHTNGSLTHPIIILFNALVTGKRILFLGYNRPAGQIASYVLSACALGSGCGAVLRGFIERAFPYANLTNRDEWETVPAYIAGVTNPIFEAGSTWDLIFDIAGGRVIVSKDIHLNFPTAPTSGGPPPLLRAGTFQGVVVLNGDDDIGRVPGREGKDTGQKSDYVAKADNADNVFMEDIISAISYHFGENLVRMRFTEYVTRFVRLASRYEQDVLGARKLGYGSTSFTLDGPNGQPALGSGILFSDELTSARELSANASRIEGWRRTHSYQLCLMDFNKAQATNAMKGFDVLHQLFRLRQTKNMPDAEVDLIMRTIAANVQTYDQVVELLAYLTPHGGGLLHLSFGLFHQQEAIRDTTVTIFNELRQHPVGVIFLQSLNHFQRYAYVRQAHARETRLQKDQQTLHLPPPAMSSRTPSNRSESSLGG